MRIKHFNETKVDDLTGREGEDVEKFTFTLDGKTYSMDACAETREEFRKAIAPFVKVAKASTAANHDSAKIREWAREHGYEVAKDGRIRKEIIEAYRKANP